MLPDMCVSVIYYESWDGLGLPASLGLKGAGGGPPSVWAESESASDFAWVLEMRMSVLLLNTRV